MAMLQAAYAQQPASQDPSLMQGVTEADITAYPEVSRQLARGDGRAALATLHSYLAEHENDPAYFNLIGTLALKIGDYPAAEIAFERVVLMQPDNAGAWMDLAIAATETGNFSGATSYFDHIESAFAPSPVLRVVIAGYRARIAAPRSNPYGWRIQAEAIAGYDSNANSGIQNGIIPLTVGADRVDLPLDPAYFPRGDRFAQVAASAVYRQRIDAGAIELAASVRQRSYANEHDFSTLDLNIGAGLRRPTRLGELGLGINASHLALGSSPLMLTLRAVLQLENSVRNCRAGLGLEAERRRYYTLNALDANILWGQTGLACDWSFATVPLQSTLIARGGTDRPTGMRAGGDIRHRELIAQLSAPVAWGMVVEISHTIARAYDADGYSPLLEQNAPRSLDRRSNRLALTQPLAAGTDAVLIFENSRVFSNLPLFQQGGRVVSIGIRKSY